MSGVLTLLDQPRHLNAFGNPSPMRVGFFLSGTNSPAPIWANEAMTVPYPNPFEVAAGELFPDVFLDPTIKYRRRIMDLEDGTNYDVDPLPVSGSAEQGLFVSSVNASGGTTGMTFAGGPVTDQGVLTLGGVLSISNGGTGASSASNARDSLSAFARQGGAISGGVWVNGVESLSGSLITPDVTNRNFATYTNSGAFTLAAPSSNECYTSVVEIINAASGAGAMSVAGFQFSDLYDFTTTANARFEAHIISFGSGKKRVRVIKAS